MKSNFLSMFLVFSVFIGLTHSTVYGQKPTKLKKKNQPAQTEEMEKENLEQKKSEKENLTETSDEEKISKPETRRERRQRRRRNRVTSEATRSERNFSVHAEIGFVDVAFGKGLRLGLLLSPNSIVEVSYFDAEFSFIGFETKYQIMEARFKQFLGNSFYLFGGGGVQNMDGTEESRIFGNNNPNSFSSSHTILSAGLGNNWSFGAFSLGCDWAAILLPIATMNRSETLSDDSSSQATIEDDRKKFERRSDSEKYMFVRFYLGAQF